MGALLKERKSAEVVYPLRSRVVVSGVALAAGVILGISAPLVSTGAATGHVVSLVLSAGWAWAALAFGVGVARKSKLESAVLACASLVVAVIAYYVARLWRGGFLAADLNDHSGRTTHIDWGSFLSNIAMWCIAACVLGPLLGLAGNIARNRGLRGILFRVLIPLIAIVDTSQRLQYDAPRQGAVAETTWSVIRLTAVAAIVVVAAHAVIAVWLRSSSRQVRG